MSNHSRIGKISFRDGCVKVNLDVNLDLRDYNERLE